MTCLLHIGLGKTSTSTLQNAVLPTLAEIRNDISITDQKFRNVVQKHHLFGLTDTERKYVEAKTSGKCVASVESLVGWDPFRWEEYADRNLSLFGPDVHILITIRETEAYMRSVYQQIVLHQGNIVKPESFFVDNKTYTSIARQTNEFRLQYFNVDALDYERLVYIYKQRFKKVTVITLSQIAEMNIFLRVFDLQKSEVEILKNAYQNSKKSNVSYSELSTKLTLLRERAFRSIGFRSVGSDDRDLIEVFGLLEIQNDNRYDAKCMVKQRDRKRFLKALTYRLRWRSVLRYGVDRFFPYHPYELPHSIYRNRSLAERNDELITKLNSLDGK